MAIKKKPATGKPMKGPLKSKAPQPDAEQDDATSAPAALPDLGDELALQEAPETKYPGEQFKRPRKKEPVQNTGTALDIHDTSKLLIFAWIVIGAVVAISVYLLLLKSDNHDDEVVHRSSDGSPLVVTPAKPVAPKPENKDAARYVSNPANKAAVEAYLKFGNWAYTEALTWDGKQLTDKMKSDVPLGNVDDPDVRELIRLQAENFNLLSSHPLRPYEAQLGGTGEATRGNESANLNSFKLNENKIKGLTSALRQRYTINLK